MVSYWRALTAEIRKYRRTVAVWLALGIPVLIIGLAFLILTRDRFDAAGVDEKWRFLQGITAQTWTTMCLPIGGAILIGMLWGLEHSSNQFKHILAQPPSRHAIFWAKTSGIFGMIALGTVFLGVLTVLLANVLELGPTRWRIAFELPARAFLASLPTLALVSWVAQRYASFALPLILGVVGVVVGGLASASAEFWAFVPWSWPIVASVGADPEAKGTALLLATGGSVLVLLLSWWHFFRADAPK